MDTFHREFLPQLAEIPHARQDLREWLDQSGVRGDATYDAIVVASELVTNGVLHGGNDPITVEALRQADELHLEVTTTERGPGQSPNVVPLDRRESGRGLQIVAALSDEHSVRIDGVKRVVSCRLRLRPAPPPDL